MKPIYVKLILAALFSSSIVPGYATTYPLSGSTTTAVSLTGTAWDITADSTFTSTVSSGNAVSVTSTGTDLNFTQVSGSSIIGGNSAIFATNNGTGVTTISTAGSIKGGDSGMGINVASGAAIQKGLTGLIK